MPAAATSIPARDRGRRRIAAWLTGTLAGLLAALLVCEALGWSFLRPLLQQQASRRLGTEVTLSAPMQLQLIGPPRLRLGGLRVGAARDSGAPFLVDATTLEALWHWRDVWQAARGEPLVLVALRAERLESYLRRDAQGRASWQFRPSDPHDPGAGRPPPRAGWLEVREGHIHLDDAPSRLQLEIRASVDDGDAGARAPGGLFLSAEGRYRGRFRVAGRSGPAAAACRRVAHRLLGAAGHAARPAAADGGSGHRGRAGAARRDAARGAGMSRRCRGQGPQNCAR